MTIGENRYDDKIRSEASFEADGLQRPTLHAIAAAMVNDVVEKADKKLNPKVSSAEEEITPKLSMRSAPSNTF